jgi:ATP-dependent Clp endopeptidase proteolytic subunit ClpP
LTPLKQKLSSTDPVITKRSNVTYPEFKLFTAPSDATPEQVKDIVAANTAILDYRSKIDDIGHSEIDKEKDQLDLEKLRIELERTRNFLRRDADAFRYNNGIFTLYDYVDDYSVKQVISDITVWHSHAPKGAPLQLNINSYGGSVTDGFALFDTLRFVARDGERKIKTVSLGITASMGGVLLQAGDERVMTPSSILLVHEISYGARGSTANHRDNMEMTEILTDRIVEVFCERGNLTPEEFRATWDRRDWWLSAKQAFELGFADRVDFN